MGNAIAHVFPNSGHRLCSWHIGRNSMKYLVDLKSKDGFMRDYTNWLHLSESIEAFEDRWGELKATYNIDDKHWLSRMYEIRSKWVSLYWQDTFTAGMTTTQRSESINSFFDGFVNAQTPLDEFVMQYDKALLARRNVEESEDFKTLNSIANFYTGHPIERHVGEVYTRAVFDTFQAELPESDSMLAERIRYGSDNAKYAICNHVVVFGKNCTEDGEPYATCSYMYEKIMPKLNDIFEMVTEKSNAPEHSLSTKQNEENQEVIGSCSLPTFSCDNDVYGELVMPKN
ncbi:protein FAR1-RELATED SEQUENCE 5-like [Dioscorea cayenensis subsp. rotundata]|uniref:Protein FAR1-RELATED SEQUENCE n=1 Tax=Dioscorea cayennensis subsp. rotundata TaxID=55577 RepID=A0AB40CVD5_DIOCR|nr:protein FAR1-RELATED SEQUENCE 5-like [Dioscorea cayenensis subsp. rotundata]